MPQHTPAPSREDLYPSRCGLQAQVQERIDPTVYAEDWSQGPISEAQIRCYEEQGFLVLEDVFSAAELAELQAEQERLRSVSTKEHSAKTISEPGSGDMRSVFRVHKISKVFGKLAADKRLADIARYLLDDEVYIHQSRLN